MTNDECLMTKEARMTNDKNQSQLPGFGFGRSDFFRHSIFVIRHSPKGICAH